MSRWLPRFGLRTLILAITVASVGLAFLPRQETQPIGYWIGQPGVDWDALADGTPAGVHHLGGMHPRDKSAGPLGGHLVVFGYDLQTADGKHARKIAETTDRKPGSLQVHFAELVGHYHYKLRSFHGTTGSELPESIRGALATLMIGDQISVVLAKRAGEKRGRADMPGRPITVEFMSGRKLKIEFTNDVGTYLLRCVEGPPDLCEQITVISWGDREVSSAAAQPSDASR